MPKDELQDGATYQNLRGDFLIIEARGNLFLDQYGRVYAPTGLQMGHTERSTGNVGLSTAGTAEGWRDEAEYARKKWPDEFDCTDKQEEDERADEADLHRGSDHAQG